MAALLPVAVPRVALAAPAVSLSPNSGPPLTTVAIRGSGFTASSQVTATLNGNIVLVIATDPSGGFAASFSVPPLAPGTYPVVATDTSGLAASAPFTVTAAAPVISVGPPFGPSGTSAFVGGSNFTASSGVSVTFNGVVVASTSTDPTGAFRASFTVPVVAVGTYEVAATDAAGLHATTPFGVTVPPPPPASVSLSPTFGLSGTQVTVNGTAFTPASTVTLTFNGTPVGVPTTADAAGKFASTFVVPALSPGTYLVAASDSAGLRASRPFTIVPLPTILIPGHPFQLIPARVFDPFVIAADPDSGVLYGLSGDVLHPHWELTKFSGGNSQVLSELTAPTSVVFGSVSVSMFSDLVFADGFGGADLLSVDTLGHTVALSAAGGPQRPFAPTTGSFLAGLALSGDDRLFVSSGFVGQSTAIYAVDPTGAVSTFLAGSPSRPGSLAISPDGHTLYYADTSTFISGDLVKVDVATATETGRVRIGPPFSISRLAVDPATGDVYASVVDVNTLLTGGGSAAPVGQIVRYQPSTGLVQTFADSLTSNFDLTFGPCNQDQEEGCLFVTTGIGVIKIHGFEPSQGEQS